MIHSGVRKVVPDHRDRSYPRTFGTTTTFPDELNLDVGFGFPDQNADGYPNGCTGYTQADIAADEDTIEYQPRFTYDKTRMMEGTYPEDVGCDIRDSLESTIAYGLLAKGETTDDQAGFHRRGAYYNVVDDPNLDAFDDVRSAIATNRRSVSCVTPWFAEWEYPVKGVIAAPKTLTGYHNWKICGWTQIAGTPYLIGKSWQGPRYGDSGYHYVSREIFNAVMAMPGSGCFTLRKAVAADYARVKLAIFQTVLSYMRLWLISLFSHPMPQTPPEPQNTPSQPVSPSPDSDTVPPTVPESGDLQWDTPAHAWHAVRVMCDDAGLTLDQKNVISACVYQESHFNNSAEHENKDTKGNVLSTDFGIVQVNDYYHIGPGKDFPSVQYVLDNPDKAVAFMLAMFKSGKLSLWTSYSSGAYKQWLSTSSPMWALAD